MRAAAALGAALMLLSACGWQLRGGVPESTYTGGLTALNVVTENRSNPFFRAFSGALTRYAIEDRDDAELTLQLSRERQERQPLTYGSTGVPAQYQLILEVQYQVSRDGELLIPQRRINTRRTYDFDPDLIIAKDREQEELLAEMREELADRIFAAIVRMEQ